MKHTNHEEGICPACEAEEDMRLEEYHEMKEEGYRIWKKDNLSELESEFCEDIMSDEFNEWCLSRYNMLDSD